MERSDDASSLPATVNYSDESSPRHHPPSSSADVTAWGRPTCPGVRRVACSGDGKEEESDSHHSLRGPIRCSPEAREAGDGQGARPSPGDDVTRTDSTVCSHSMASCTEGSKVNHCYRLDTGGHSGGGATGGTDCHTPPSKASKVNINPVTRESDTDSDTQDGDLTFDLQEVSSDDETFITEPPPPQGEMSLPPAASRSRNTYECGRRQSAPGQLVQDGSQAELQSRRPGIVDYFSSRQRSISHSVPGWKLFGKVPPRQIPSKHSRIIQQQIAAVSLSSPSSPDLRRSAEYEARQVAAQSSPTQHAAGQQQSRRNVEFEPLSTTALILEDRPPNLPAKSAEETQRHRQQYEQMVAGAKRRELKEAQRRQQQMKERFRQEDVIANTALIWNKHILPHWDAMKSSRRARDLWWAGLPPSVRGRVWSLAIGNELNITAELYEIFLSRAKEKWRNLGETQADAGAPPADSESSLQLIRRDVSRTLASLCVFQKGGPYHDLLQSILGAYTCYRPDVGYMQGMASLAAMLILNMDEVEAFISFSNLINKPCQLTFYRVDHQLMFRYFGAFEVFFKENLPRLFLHFQSTGVTSDLYLMDWVLSLYTKPLPLDVACRVWDVFLRDGEEFLFRTGLGILRLHQDVLLQMDLISIAQFLARLPDEELLSDRLFSCISATPMLSGNRKWIQVQQLNKPEDSML